jgi:hypothetical protein
VLGIPYVSSSGVGCFLAAGVCVEPGTFTQTSLVFSVFNASGQDILTDVSYAGILTTLAHVPIGPINLTGTLEQEILGRTFPTELGTWNTELLALSLSGLVLGHTLTLTLDGTTPSTGVTSIGLVGSTGDHKFRIDSFFDVFVDLTLDTPTPLHTTRGPIHATLVPEPGTMSLLGLSLAVLGIVRRRKPRATGA